MNVNRIGIALASLAVVVLAGCHKSEETVYSGPEGSMTVDRNNNKVTVTDDKGNAATLGGGVSEADLGVPFYPGSTETANASGTIESGGDKMVTSSRTTTDAPSKVSAFYKEKVKGAQSSSANAGGNEVEGLTGKLADESDFNMSATKTGTQPTQITIVVKRKKS